MLNLQPVAAIDYETFNALGDRGVMTGEWLAHCQACSAPEIANVFNTCGIDYHLVTGWLKEDYAWEEIGSWVDAIAARREIRDTRVGILGHYYAGMLDVYTDVTRLADVFGCHFELIEMDQLKRSPGPRRARRTIRAKLAQFQKEFRVSPECGKAELERAARTSCALDSLAAASRLGAMAYYYEGVSGSEHEDIVTSVIAGNTLLTAHHVPIAGECEVKNVMAMKIMDCLGAGGSFSELYAIDFNDDVVLWGHDGPAHPAIAEGPVGLVPLPVYHGKPGKGLSIQMSVRHRPRDAAFRGPGTGRQDILPHRGGRIGSGSDPPDRQHQQQVSFPPARPGVHGQVVQGGSRPSLRHRVGHIADRIEKLADLLSIECLRVC